MDINGENILMSKLSLRRSVVMHYFIVVFFTVLMLEIIFLISIHTYYYDSISDKLTGHVTATSSHYQRYNRASLKQAASDLLPELLKIFHLDNTEIQILDRTGKVLISSSGFRIDKPLSTPDIINAQNGQITNWIGKQHGTGEAIMAISAPIMERGDIGYILRLVTSLENVNNHLHYIVFISIAIAIAILIIVLLISHGLANSIVKPINEIIAVSAQMARGRFNVQVKEDYKYELGKLARTLNFLSHEIIRSNQCKNDFISSISHELRTPLTGIKGWSETLLYAPLPKEETKLGLQVIHNETERLIGLVEELLDFSKLQDNKLQFHCRLISLRTIIEDTILQVRMKAEQKLIRLENQVWGNELSLYADPNRLKQIFLNLVDNAVKFSPNNAVITIHTTWTEENAVVRIVDQGIGISEEHLTKVMDKFYQVNPGYGGTGLGLAITNELVKSHGGEMIMESKSNMGTTVIVTLPVCSPTEYKTSHITSNHLEDENKE